MSAQVTPDILVAFVMGLLIGSMMILSISASLRK